MELLSTKRLRRVLESEIGAAGGKVKDVFDDGQRLFMRSVLPRICEVRPKDRMQGGVALKYVGQVVISPYVFRKVCENGAIWAHSLQSTRIAVDSAETDIREAVQACCAPEVFAANIEEVRRSLNAPADRALMMMPAFSQLAASGNHRVIAEIIDLYLSGPERTGFGLMNAITATARDQSDVELRWDLEECGGGVPALLTTPLTLHHSAAKRLEDDMVERVRHEDARLAAESDIRDLAAVA